MPAFGKNGIVNINQSQSKDVYNIVKQDGSIVASSNDKGNAEQLKSSLEKQLNCDLTIQEKTLNLI